MARRSAALSSLPWNDSLVALLDRTGTAIARLDARVTASSVVPAWRLRAAWSGYARALQLQSIEIDEIDVYSWGCALPLPGRHRLSTTQDPFAAFADWRTQFAGNAKRHWREDLGALVVPDPGYAGPQLIRALETLRQISIAVAGIEAWLALPLLLQRLGVTRVLLPCLVTGEKRLRFDQPADEALLRRLLKALAHIAEGALDRLDTLERDRLRAARAILAARRPGALPRLLARLQVRPIASPQAIADEFEVTISGAGKLLTRAADAALVVEVRGTQSWKLYAAHDLAVTLGLSAPKRGRPRVEPPPLPHDRSLAEILRSFDDEMAAFDQNHESALVESSKASPTST